MKDDKKKTETTEVEEEVVVVEEEKLRDEDLEDATGGTFVVDWEPDEPGSWFKKHGLGPK